MAAAVLLSEEQLYALNVEGFVVIPQVVSEADLRGGSGGGGALARHPLVQQLVSHVFESGVVNIPTGDASAAPGADGQLDFSGVFQLDAAPSELSPTADGVADFSAPEHAIDGARLCYGVTAVVALADNEPGHSIVVVPSTHHSTLAAPDLRAWDAELAELHHSSTDDLGVTVPVPLGAGDLFLSAATLMQSVRGAPTGLFKFEYLAAGAFPSAGLPQPPPLPAGAEPPAWMGELSEEEMAVVGPRTVGLSPTDPKLVLSDGTKTWVEDRPAAYDTPRGNPAVQPPSVFKRVVEAGGETSEVDARDLCVPSSIRLYSVRVHNSQAECGCTVGAFCLGQVVLRHLWLPAAQRYPSQRPNRPPDLAPFFISDPIS